MKNEVNSLLTFDTSYIKRIALVLDNTMYNANYYDEWSEIISDMIDKDSTDDEVLDFAKGIAESVDFVNKYAREPNDQIVNDFVEEAIEWMDYYTK